TRSPYTPSRTVGSGSAGSAGSPLSPTTAMPASPLNRIRRSTNPLSAPTAQQRYGHRHRERYEEAEVHIHLDDTHNATGDPVTGHTAWTHAQASSLISTTPPPSRRPRSHRASLPNSPSARLPSPCSADLGTFPSGNTDS